MRLIFTTVSCTKGVESSYQAMIRALAIGYNLIPINNPINQIHIFTECSLDAKPTMPGPGHTPPNPQPIPKINDPITSFLSTFVNVGTLNVENNIGFVRFKINGNAIIVIANPPPITNINDGSHDSQSFTHKKFRTLIGCVIPDIANPFANANPIKVFVVQNQK